MPKNSQARKNIIRRSFLTAYKTDVIALLIHIYYPDSWEKIFREQLMALNEHPLLIMINLCIDNTASQEIAGSIKKDYPGAYVIITPNKGKDIGGKLALIDLFIRTEQRYDYIIFLHDKISPYAITGERWRAKLFSIIQPEKIKAIEKKFHDEKNLGVVGPRDFILNEYDEKKQRLETTNKEKLEELIFKYKLNLTGYTFIAGTMFWIRSQIIKNFFSAYTPLDCRELLEPGNTTDQYEGTYTHSWERVLCWLANDQGYTIKGV